MVRPLTGIKVVDFSTLLPGPLATLLLAEAGAAVTKIEKPGGDDMRHFPPFLAGRSAAYRLLNNAKTIVELDLKSAKGKAQALQLAGTADVVVEQFRPGVMDRLGLGYETLKASNRNLIYCSITGYGQAGPRAKEAGHDINYLGMTGLLAQSWGDTEKPALPLTQIADIGGGSLPAVINILLALIGRERMGQGCHLDIAMADAMFMFGIFAQAYAASGEPIPDNGTGLLTGGSPRYNIYPAKCGTPVCVGALEEHFWQRLCDVLELGPEERNDRRDPKHVRERIGAAFATRTASDWAPLLHKADCCATILQDLSDAMADPHFRERGLFDRSLGDVQGLVPALPVPLSPLFRGGSNRRGDI